MLPTDIHWSLVGKAIDFYVDHGFTYIESPWVVTKEYLRVTLPYGRVGIPGGDGFLVGSAEQGFVQMMGRKEMGPGSYVSAGPCFRDEDVDELHLPRFFKVELISVGALSSFLALQLAELACLFFRSVLPDTEHQGAVIIETEPSESGTLNYDIEIAGIEIGSYGCRSYKNLNWNYGTGLALPRFTQALEKR